MAGHSKWKQIKHKKGAADQKRGALFSKLLVAITVAAKENPSPEFNPRLRAAIEKAKENLVPLENIERAVKKTSEAKNIEYLVIEAYGHDGAAILIEAITDNKNKTISEIKKILSDHGAKFAEPGSVLWAFEKIDGSWRAKFKQEASLETKQKLQKLTEELLNQNETQGVYTNTIY